MKNFKKWTAEMWTISLYRTRCRTLESKCASESDHNTAPVLPYCCSVVSVHAPVEARHASSLFIYSLTYKDDKHVCEIHNEAHVLA